MQNEKKLYVTAGEAAEMLGVSTGYAYKLIRGLNKELKAKGYRTICGKVPIKYFEKILQYDRSHVGKERFYVSDKEQKDGGEKGIHQKHLSALDFEKRSVQKRLPNRNRQFRAVKKNYLLFFISK